MRSTRRQICCYRFMYLHSDWRSATLFHFSKREWFSVFFFSYLCECPFKSTQAPNSRNEKVELHFSCKASNFKRGRYLHTGRAEFRWECIWILQEARVTGAFYFYFFLFCWQKAFSSKNNETSLLHLLGFFLLPSTEECDFRKKLQIGQGTAQIRPQGKEQTLKGSSRQVLWWERP